MSVWLLKPFSVISTPYWVTFGVASIMFFGTVAGGFMYSLIHNGRVPSIALEYLEQADEWLRTGQPIRAVYAYRTASTVAPDDDRTLLKLGLAAHEAGLPGQAKEALLKLLALRPTEPTTYYLLGLLSLEEGALDESIRLNELAIRLRPDYAEAYNNLGTAWLRKGHPEKAVPYYQQAIRTNPFLEAARKNLDAIPSTSD